MNPDLAYLFALLLAGAAVSGMAAAAVIGIPTLRHWPALWAASLMVTVAIPVSGYIILVSAPELSAAPAAIAASIPLNGLFGEEPLSTPIQPETSDLAWWSWLPTLVLAVYLSGAAASLVRLCLGRWRASRIAAAATGPHRLAGIPYWLSDKAIVPFAYGGGLLLRETRIVVPRRFANKLGRDAQSMIVRHEHAHLVHHDDRLGLALRIVLAISWFSPFAHWLFARWRQATEIRSDAAALANQSDEMRSVYANTLIEALHIMAGRVRQYPAASFSTHRIRSEKMRITQIMSGNPTVFKRGRATLVLAAMAGGISAIGGLAVAANGQVKPGTEVQQARAVQSLAQGIVDGKITAGFGDRADPFQDGKIRMHKGLDIAAPTGTPIHAPSDGSIVEATNLFDNKPNYGIEVVHRSSDGLLTLFAHLDGFTVVPGQTVKKGELIAMVGNTGKSTGPHVHIETIRDGRHVDPVLAWPELK